jgi:hypothetical protein
LIEPRIYRAAFVPALLAVVLVMFSLESRPRPLPQGLAADVLFDGEQAAVGAREIAAQYPDRTPGSAGSAAVAREVRAALRGAGFTAADQAFEYDGRELVNVIGRRAGESRRQIVVVAARDAPARPDAAGSAADTAALIELARVFEGRPSRKSLVLASVDGSTLGEVGTVRLLEELDEPELVDAVLLVSGLGAGSGAPTIAAWGNTTTRAGISLQRTVAESLRSEFESPAGGPGSLGQLARLAFPLGVGGQGVLIAKGYDAVRISGDGELADAPADAPVDEPRLGALGRATLRAITALDQGRPPERGERTYLTVAGQVLPGWPLALLAGTLLLPALAVSIDALARARRRGASVVPWLLWIGAGAVSLVAGLVLAKLLSLVGAIPEPPQAPVAPDLYPVDVAALVAMGAVGAGAALAWVGLRHLTARRDRELADPAAPGAGVAVALMLSGAGVALWLVDPFAALLAVPAVHLWLLAVLVDPPPAPRVRVALIAGGLVLPGLLALYQLLALDANPVAGAWYLLLLLVGGQVGLPGAAVGAVFLATLASVVAISRRSAGVGAPPPPPPSTRGPLGYAGPGSLGGTDSALRR